MNNQITNGRLDLLNYQGGTPLFLQDMVPNRDKSNYYNTIKYTLQNTQLSNLFFSIKNTEIIENGIKKGVYEISNGNYVIDKQDPDNLNIIMRAIYFQYAIHQPTEITKQIEVLNKKVIDYSVPIIFSELKSYDFYKRDVSNLPIPMERPSYYHKDNTLELKNFF
jgi:hypothetical protein